jgi:hypothetical protein
MDRDDEILLEIKGLAKITDSDERIDAEHEICKKIDHYPENHALVQAYYAETRNSLCERFDPADM